MPARHREPLAGRHPKFPTHQPITNSMYFLPRESVTVLPFVGEAGLARWLEKRRHTPRLGVPSPSGRSLSQRAAPGEVMVPWNEPKVKCVLSLSAANACIRSTGKLPWAPVNRPVPPVMV